MQIKRVKVISTVMVEYDTEADLDKAKESIKDTFDEAGDGITISHNSPTVKFGWKLKDEPIVLEA